MLAAFLNYCYHFVVPADVQQLMIPNPQCDQHKFYNSLITKYACVRTLLTEGTFRAYANSEKISKWKEEEKVRGFEKMISQYENSKDGHWSNVRKYSSSENVTMPSEANRLDNAMDFILDKMKSVEVVITNLTKLKGKPI